MSKTLCILHIVFATKRREMTIPEEHKRDLYAYIFGLLKNKKCFVYRINGIPNHIHMLIDLNPTVALADLIKEVKLSTHQWIKQNRSKFPNFYSWGEGYYAASISADNLENCKTYIINQERHHLGSDLVKEMEQMASMNGFAWHPDDWK